MTKQMTISRVISKTRVKVKSLTGQELIVYCDKGYKVGDGVLVSSGTVLNKVAVDSNVRVFEV